MENDSAFIPYHERPRLPCYCWKCYVKADILHDFGALQNFKCPRCQAAILVGEPDSFGCRPDTSDESDSVSVCVSPTTSRRSTYSESEAGGNGDVDSSPVTPDTSEQSVRIPSAPTNTPASGGDVPDAPENIAKDFAEVTNFLLRAPASKRKAEPLSTDEESSDSSDSVFYSPYRMILNVVQAYKNSLGMGDGTQGNANGRQGHSIKVRVTPNSDKDELKPAHYERKENSKDELRCGNSEAGEDHDFKKAD